MLYDIQNIFFLYCYHFFSMSLEYFFLYFYFMSFEVLLIWDTDNVKKRTFIFVFFIFENFVTQFLHLNKGVSYLGH